MVSVDVLELFASLALKTYGNNLRYHSLSDQNWGGDIMHDSVAGDVGIAPSPATV